LELAEGTSADEALLSRISETLRESVKVRGDVRAAAPGTIPQGAKRIDDRRVWR
jgi:hypothetical protein